MASLVKSAALLGRMLQRAFGARALHMIKDGIHFDLEDEKMTRLSKLVEAVLQVPTILYRLEKLSEITKGPIRLQERAPRYFSGAGVAVAFSRKKEDFEDGERVGATLSSPTFMLNRNPSDDESEERRVLTDFLISIIDVTNTDDFLGAYSLAKSGKLTDSEYANLRAYLMIQSAREANALVIFGAEQEVVSRGDFAFDSMIATLGAGNPDRRAQVDAVNREHFRVIKEESNPRTKKT